MTSSVADTAVVADRAASEAPTNVRDTLSSWWFPDLEGPDLSSQVVEGQHEALMLLNDHTVAEIFADDEDETESEPVGAERQNPSRLPGRGEAL